MHKPDADDQRCGLPTSQLSLKGLDWLVHSDPGPCGDDDGASESDVVSEALSVMSAMSAFDLDDVVPIDSERYARICGKIERLRRAVGKRDVKVREAKARLAEQRRSIRSMRGELLSLQAQVATLSSQVDRESAAKVEAIDKAAVALLDRERLQQENERLRGRERLATNHLKTQHASSTQMGDLHLKASEEAYDLRAQLAVVAQEKTQLELECCDIRGDLEDAQHRLVELSQRNSELENQVIQLKETNDQNDRRCTEQQRQLVRGEEERGRLQDLLADERKENKHHAAHLLQTVIKLQDDLERVKSQYRRAKEGSLVLREANGMLNEELWLSCMETERAKRAVSSYQEQLQAASREYYAVVKQCRELDASRRRMLAVFVPTRKQLAVIDAGMSKLCLELQRIGKTVAVGRYREAALGQALREYGKRNRELQSGLGAAKQKLRAVAGALRSSEKRKSVAVASNATLKRDLVLEKCQRSELLQQCQELSTCLDRCQGVANETQERADLLHAENDSLQLAVQQLVAYAQVLAESQRELQRELTHLEVVGRREPAVFG